MNRLRDLREDNDLFQKDISKMLNISQRTYSHYETGDYGIPNCILKKLAIFYNTSTDYILGLTNIIVPYENKKQKTKQV